MGLPLGPISAFRPHNGPLGGGLGMVQNYKIRPRRPCTPAVWGVGFMSKN